MDNKQEVLDIVDERIDRLKQQIEHFEQFGRKYDTKEVLGNCVRREKLGELISLKSSLEYSVRWRATNG